jgi:hypothetical protein
VIVPLARRTFLTVTRMALAKPAQAAAVSAAGGRLGGRNLKGKDRHPQGQGAGRDHLRSGCHCFRLDSPALSDDGIAIIHESIGPRAQIGTKSLFSIAPAR